MSRTRPLPSSFHYAYDGIKEALKNEPNFRIHMGVALLALIGAVVAKFSIFEWLLLLFTIVFVLILELLNTSIESLVDLVSPEVKPKAKIAKDVSAAMVLVAAGMSIIVGALLFISNLLSK